MPEEIDACRDNAWDDIFHLARNLRRILLRRTAMNAFSEWLRKLGALHDAVVKSFSWRPGSQVLEVDFEDIYQNFEGLPEYPGAQAGTVVLHGVTHLTVD